MDLFLIQSQGSPNPIELFSIMCMVLWPFLITLAICEFGEMLTNKFHTFNDSLCQCNWYYYPNEVQRMLVIVIANAQQPLIFCGFGNIPISRFSFKKVTILCILLE